MRPYRPARLDSMATVLGRPPIALGPRLTTSRLPTSADSPAGVDVRPSRPKPA